MPRHANRMAPPRFVGKAGLASPEALSLYRGLRMAVVPIRAGVAPVGGMGASGYELVNSLGPVNNGGVGFRGEAHGPALGCVNAGLGFSTTATIVAKMIPNAVPFSCFAFVVRRDSSATIQSLCGNGYLSNNGWTFQLNYGAGQIGLTRWGIADNPSTTLGAVPNTGGQASAVGMTLDGTNARFFLNGVFQTVASGTVVAPTSTGLGFQVGSNSNAAQVMVNTSIHVVYVWNRVLSDSEMLRLWQDPWLLVRPRAAPSFLAGSVSTTIARITQAALEALIQLPVQTRATQVLVEALIAAPVTASTARLSTLVLEALTQPDAAVRLTQLALEVLTQPVPGVRVTQLSLEALVQPVTGVRITQAVLEALVQPSALSVPLAGQLFPRGSVTPF